MNSMPSKASYAVVDEEDGPTAEEDGDPPTDKGGLDNLWGGFPSDLDEVLAEDASDKLPAVMPENGSSDHTSMFYTCMGTNFGRSEEFDALRKGNRMLKMIEIKYFLKRPPSA